MKKKLHNKRSNWIEYIIINLFVFAGLGLLSFVVFNVSLFNPFTKAFKDFTLTDLYYSQAKNQDTIFAGPLVLINVENKNREEIAFLLERLQEGKPKVIGLDIIFKDQKDSAYDESLKQTFAKYNNIVIPYIASFDNSVEEIKNHEYFQVRSNAFINTLGEDPKFSTLRNYHAVYNSIPHFTTAIMQMYDPVKANLLLERDQKKTEINYWGNLENFKYNTFDEVMHPDFQDSVLKDKIVLLGYMGKTDGISGMLDEDRFYTPLNPRLSGRSHPDMYGAIVHANILRMTLDEDHIYSFPQWLNLLVAFMLSLILLPWLIKVWVHKAVWFHLYIMLVQLSVSILFVFLTILLYAKANLKIESAAILVSVLLLGDFILFYDSIVQFLKRKLNWNFHSKFFEGAH